MGRGQVKDSHLARPATGKEWSAFRRQLFREWSLGGARPVYCFACGCEIPPGLGEVEHRISARRRPDLAWTRVWMGAPFLVPVHGSGRKRCPLHDLACNAVIGSNVARRDELGRSVPLTAAEITAAMERARAVPRSSTGRDRAVLPPLARVPGYSRPPQSRPRVYDGAGRPW
jgi:hypothetical protein